MRRKGAEEEWIPLNYKACVALKAWLAERKQKTEKATTENAVFLNKYRKAISKRSVQSVVKKYMKEAGISNASTHTLRHTMATHYLAKGGDIKSVQAMLGHESLLTTQIYLGMAKGVQKKMVQEFAL